jgi:PAS domain S-box-containing protein
MRTPIRRRLMVMGLVTSGTALLLTVAAFLAYDIVTFRQSAVRNIATLSEVIAANSTAALAFDIPEDATEVLSSLDAEPNIVAASLYSSDGRLFARYPADAPDDAFPAQPSADGFLFRPNRLDGFQAVVQNGTTRLGTLYLRSDTRALYDRLALYGLVAVFVLAASLAVAYAISRKMQRQISQPLLALTRTASAVSERRDYSVRAAQGDGLEIGRLTDAFNHMLSQIQGQDLQLRESESRVRAVLDSALSAVVVIDGASRIVDWNARAEAIFGWSRREVLGEDLASLIIPERHREAHRRAMAQYLQTGDGPIIGRTLELSALRRSGDEFPVELAVSAVRAGESVNFCGFLTDITERKEAQGRVQAQLGRLELLNRITRAIGDRLDLPSIFTVVLRNLEDNLPIDFGCVCQYDAGNETLTVASVGHRSFEVAEAIGLMPGTTFPVGTNGLAHCVRGRLVYEPDLSQVTFPFPAQLTKGNLGSLVVAPLLAESRVFGVLFAARRLKRAFTSADTEFLRQLSEHVALAAHQSQLYAALQAAYDDLRQSQQTVMQQERLRALGQLASGIAHDINNAISPVSLYTESLLEREENLSPRAREYLSTIQRSVDDVAHTVARMREFYRPREPQLVLAQVDINKLLHQVVELTRARWSDQAQEKGIVIELKVDLDAELPCIMGAESEIRDALTNLIFNAVDAMPDGGTLGLRTLVKTTEEPDGESLQHVAVEVRDTGIGMDEETRRRCLEPFYTTKGERGTGLGLAMVFGMVQRHSADLEIDSAEGAGTIMRLIFPVPVTVVSTAVRHETRAQTLRGLRILIVDDDPLLIRSLRETLQADGHDVTAADGGQAGIDAFAASKQAGPPFDVVVTDLGMPYVDGRKVAASIRAADSEMPIVLLTGWGQRLIAENDTPHGVDRVLAKPPKLHELRSAFAELCGLKRSTGTG